MRSPVACQRDASGGALSVRHAMPPPFRVAGWRGGGTGGRGRSVLAGELVSRRRRHRPERGQFKTQVCVVMCRASALRLQAVRPTPVAHRFLGVGLREHTITTCTTRRH